MRCCTFDFGKNDAIVLCFNFRFGFALLDFCARTLASTRCCTTSSSVTASAVSHAVRSMVSGCAAACSSCSGTKSSFSSHMAALWWLLKPMKYTGLRRRTSSHLSYCPRTWTPLSRSTCTLAVGFAFRLLTAVCDSAIHVAANLVPCPMLVGLLRRASVDVLVRLLTFAATPLAV